MTENGGGDDIWKDPFHVRFSSCDHALLSYGQSFLAYPLGLSVLSQVIRLPFMAK